MALKTEIDEFISEFSAVETQFVGAALRSLSDDASFVERSERILDVEARFTLVKRIAFVRRIDPAVITQLDAVSERAARLREKRDSLNRTLHVVAQEVAAGRDAGDEVEDLWVPTAAEIDSCREGTAALRATLTDLAGTVESIRHADHARN